MKMKKLADRFNKNRLDNKVLTNNLGVLDGGRLPCAEYEMFGVQEIN